MSLKTNVKETYWFLTGQSQWAPKCFGKLPELLCPFYQGDQEFKWFGIMIRADSLPGDTLFMYWRRQLGYHVQRLRRKYRYKTWYYRARFNVIRNKITIYLRDHHVIDR